jgi:hypothetical protein
MTKRGRLWYLACLACGHDDVRLWTFRPTDRVLKPCINGCGMMELRQTKALTYALPHTSRPHRHSQKGFRPGYQEAFGRVVEDNHDFRQLQERHGTEDADAHDYENIPRDFT